MGRHHIKLPDHLYLSPPSPQPPSTLSFASAVSLLSIRSPPHILSPSELIQETSSTAFAVGHKIPGFRTSAAFLTTLRANINLDLELPDSQVNTPDSLRPTNLASSVSSLPPQEVIMADSDFAPPSALQNVPKAVLSEEIPTSEDAKEPQDPNAIPSLTTFPCDTDDQRIEALKLVADSIAQQRQITSRTLILHPITIAILVAAGGILYQYFYKGSSADWAIIVTTFAGIVMSIFAGVRAAAGPYIDEAERVGTWRWLDAGRTQKEEDASGKAIVGTGDEILLTKFGEESIGAVIFRGTKPASPTAADKKGKKTTSTSPSSASSQTKTEIRAWTVRQRYRHKGVGTALLEDAIKIAHSKGWAKGGIEFASDHANHKRVLPALFNGAMDRKEEKARTLLKQKIDEFESGSSNIAGGRAGKGGSSGGRRKR